MKCASEACFFGIAEITQGAEILTQWAVKLTQWAEKLFHYVMKSAQWNELLMQPASDSPSTEKTREKRFFHGSVWGIRFFSLSLPTNNHNFQ